MLHHKFFYLMMEVSNSLFYLRKISNYHQSLSCLQIPTKILTQLNKALFIKHLILVFIEVIFLKIFQQNQFFKLLNNSPS